MRTIAKVTLTPDQLLALLRNTTVALVRGNKPNLSPLQQAVFLAVHLDNVQHTVRDLAEALKVSKPAIIRALKKLSGFYLVRCEVDHTDRRRVLVLRTRKGSGLLGTIRRTMTNEASRSCQRRLYSGAMKL